MGAGADRQIIAETPVIQVVLRLAPGLAVSGYLVLLIAVGGQQCLASVGSTGPFVGLFGTVYGIMNSFIGIAESNTTNLAVVAPGIAEALLATGIGLFNGITIVLGGALAPLSASTLIGAEGAGFSLWLLIVLALMTAGVMAKLGRLKSY